NWLGTPGVDILTMYHYDGSTGRLDVAITRLNQQAVWGHGQLMDISIMITDDIAKRFQEIFVAEPVWGKAINPTGKEIPLSSQAQKEATPNNDPLDSWSIYPNPGRGIFTFETDQDWKTVNLYDLQGRQLMVETDLAAGKYTWDLSSLQAGVYLLQAQSPGKTSHAKLVITAAP
ncbi:MAG: T9SS type A sorting domain-containing protein, partial [Bacteroidota bacterium]